MTDPLVLDPTFAFQREHWLDAATKALKGGDFSKALVSRTSDGIEVQPLYPAAAANGPGPWRSAGAAPWRVAARVDHPDRDEAHNLALADLEGGADALTLAFRGSRAARGWGMPCDTLRDLDAALENVALDLIAVRLEPSAAGRLHAAQFAALIERRGLDPAELAIDFGLDPIGTLAATGHLPAPWTGIAQQLSADVIALRERGYRGPFFTADGRIWHEGGATPAQELAGILATLVAYLRAMEQHGIVLEDARAGLSCILTADSDQFGTIAKFRAMRRLWARVEKACRLQPTPLLIHAETAWRDLTKRDPWVNILRGTLAAFGAGVGGADTVSVHPFTSAIGLPDAFARRVARNTQLVLLEEANLWRVVDPAAGSGAVEALTEALDEAAWSLFREIDAAGDARTPGMLRMLEGGAWQAKLGEARAQREKSVANLRMPITGTSAFAHLEEAPVSVLDVPPAAAAEQSDFGLSSQPLEEVTAGFASGMTLAAWRRAIVEPVRAEPVPSGRISEPFERLRDLSDARVAQEGKRSSIFLAGLGTLAAFTPRAGFARNLFGAGGIVALANDGFARPDGSTDVRALADAFRASGSTMACLCGTDEAYAGEALAVAAALREAGCGRIILAGRPGALSDAYEAAGIRDFIFLGCDVVATLTTLHEPEGGAA